MDQTFAPEQTRPLVRVATTRSLTRLLMLVACGALVLFALYRQSAPRAVGPDAPPAEFSSARAMRHLASVAARPHPVGSDEHARVRDYIFQELTALGAAPEVQRASVTNEMWDSPVMAGTVENVVGRVEGTGGGKAVLLAAHYDSVATAPGAADDGAGVAALLETLRALRNSPPLKNDVIFLFTDGEESGLLGARAFASEHAAAREVGLVLNFEARGSAGPVMMFETSDGNGWLVGEFAKAAPRPVSNSLMREAYKVLPNSTDLAVFKDAGMAGLNFAFIESPANYHSPLDGAAQLDERSLQHHGSYALALARHFGNSDLNPAKTGDSVYFDLLGWTLVRYPATWAAPLALAAAALFVVALVVGFRKKRLRFAGVMLGALAFLLALVATGLVVEAARRLVYALHEGYGLMPLGSPYNANLYLLGFAALAAAATAAVYALFAKRTNAESLWAGSLVWWVVLMLASALVAPGVSYVLTWPALFSAAALAWAVARGGDGERVSASRAVVLVAGAVPALLLFPPLVYVLFVGLGLTAAAVVLAVVALLGGLLIPQFGLARGARRWALPGAAALAAALFIVAGGMTSGFTRERPRPTDIFYGLDGDTNRANWASTNGPDRWTSQFIPEGSATNKLPEIFPVRSPAFFTAQAPAAALAAPSVEVVSDETQNDVRTLRLRVTSPRRAPVLTFAVNSDAGVTGAAVNGRPLEETLTDAELSESKRWSLRYHALPAEGFELTVRAKASQPVSVRVVDQSYGLPQLDGRATTPRPDDMVLAQLSFNDSTFVSKSFTF